MEGGFPILFNAHTVAVPGDETTITAGGIEHPVLRMWYHPVNQAGDHRIRGIVRIRFFL
jgi:hypothetical protein